MEEPQNLPLTTTREAVDWVEQERRKFHNLYQEKMDEFEQAFQENMDWLKDYYNNITNKQQEPVVTRGLKTPSARRRRGQNQRTQIKGLFENPPIPEEALDSNLLKPNELYGGQVDPSVVADNSKIEVVITKSSQIFSDHQTTPGKSSLISDPFEDTHAYHGSEEFGSPSHHDDEVAESAASKEENAPKAPAIQFPTLSSMKSRSAENSIIEEVSEYPSREESLEDLSAQGIITSTPAANRYAVSDDSDIESLVASVPSQSAGKRSTIDEDSFDFSAVGTKKIKLAEMQNMPESMSELEDTSANDQLELEETSVIEPMVQAQEQVQPESMIIDEEPVYDTEKPQDVRFLSFEASPQSKESSRSDMGSPEPLLRHTKEQEDSPNANPVSQEDRLKAIFSTGSEKLKQALQSLRSNSSTSKSNSLDKKDVSIIQEELSSLLENTRYSVRNDDPILPEEAITLAAQILGPEYSEEIKNLSYKSRASIDDSNTVIPADIPQSSVDRATLDNEEVEQPKPDAISVDIKEQEMADEPMEHFDIASEIADATEEMDRSISDVPAPLPIKASMKSPFLKNKLLNNVADFSMIDDGDESFIQIMSDLKKIQDSLGDDDDEDMNKEEYDFDGSISDSPIENLTFKQLQEEQRLKALQQKEEVPQDEAEVEDQIEDEVEDDIEDEVEDDIEDEVEDDIEDEVEEEIDQEELHTIPEVQAELEVEVEEQPKKLVKTKSTKGKPFIKSLAAAAAAARKQQEQEEKRAAKAKEMEAKRKGLKALEPKPLPQPPKRVLRSKAKETTTTTTQPESKFKVSSAAPPPEKGKLSVFKKLAQAKNTIVSSTSTSKKTTVTTAVKPLPKIPSNVGAESKRTNKQQAAIPEDGADVESDDNHNYNELEGLDNFLDPLTPERKLKSVITTTATTFESIAIEQNGKIQLPDIPSDESDNENEKPEVPEWAQSPNLKRALMNQSRINPEAIFGKIPAVNMEELFGRKSSRYKLRQSSVWQGVDKLTFQEEMEYEKRMGWRS